MTYGTACGTERVWQSMTVAKHRQSMAMAEHAYHLGKGGIPLVPLQLTSGQQENGTAWLWQSMAVAQHGCGRGRVQHKYTPEDKCSRAWNECGPVLLRMHEGPRTLCSVMARHH